MKRLMLAWLLVAPLAGLSVALADDVYLTNGRRLSGVIVERTPTTLTLQVGPGRITLPLDRVARIVEGRSSLAQFREQAQQLDPNDVQGWLDLAAWAQQHDLLTQARE